MEIIRRSENNSPSVKKLWNNMMNWMHWLNHALDTEERRLHGIECRPRGKIFRRKVESEIR